MVSLTKILFIANQFPPIGGSGVQRSLKFVKYLYKFGHEIEVVSKDARFDLKDDSMLDEIPKTVKVHRLPAYDIQHGNILKKIYAKFLASPDAEALWFKKNKKRVLEIYDRFKPDVVYTTSYPYSAHLFGLFLKKERDAKWIVDYRDEWTNNPFHLDSFYNRIKLFFEKKKELEVNRNCDYLITNTSFMLKNFMDDSPNLKGKSSYIPNGYDEDDFIGIYPKDKDHRFTVSHIGALYGRRNLDDFAQAMKELVLEGKIMKEDFIIRIVGNVKESVIQDYKKNYQLEENIVNYGYLSHRESIRKLLEGDVSLLLIGKGKGSENFYTGKLFEYLRAKKPILAIVPENGAAARAIEECNAGIVCEPADVEAIKRAVLKLYEMKLENEEYRFIDGEIKKYARDRQAEELEKIIYKIMEE